MQTAVMPQPWRPGAVASGTCGRPRITPRATCTVASANRYREKQHPPVGRHQRWSAVVSAAGNGDDAANAAAARRMLRRGVSPPPPPFMPKKSAVSYIGTSCNLETLEEEDVLVGPGR